MADYSFSAAIEAASHYRAATDVACFVIDSRGNVQGTPDIFHSCLVCSQLYGERPGQEVCRKTHLYGCYQSERFGGRYHYFCPASLNYWASPIMFDGVIQGAMIAGPVLLIEREELLNDILNPRHQSADHLPQAAKKIDTENLRTLVKRIKRITPSRAHSLAELLFYTAVSVSDTSSRILLDKNDELAQQSRISEYIHHIKTMEGQERPGYVYPIEKERELLHMISKGDKKNAQAMLNELLGSVFFSAGKDFEMVKSRVMELVVLLSRAAMEGGADTEQIFGLNYTYLSQVHSFRSTTDLAYWLSRILERFTDLVFDLKDIKHTDAIYKAIQYIHEHYARRITLEEVASEVYLSPAYFSKIFRQEVGSTFKSYLNQIRIEKSKILLRDRNIQLIDVAGMVGYEDQSYYTKVFKKFAGTSPGKYRESWGHFPQDKHEIHEA
ncbi:MAG: AraC family transcriptional regulator [Spirochaetia bacterium]